MIALAGCLFVGLLVVCGVDVDGCLALCFGCCDVVCWFVCFLRVVALLFAELVLVVFGLCYCVAGYLLDVRSLILRCALYLMPCV